MNNGLMRMLESLVDATNPKILSSLSGLEKKNKRQGRGSMRCEGHFF